MFISLKSMITVTAISWLNQWCEFWGSPSVWQMDGDG